MARVKDQTRRRQDFIDAARRRVVEQGLSPTRVRDIAAEANLSPGLVSYYFPDLDELFREVYSDAVDRFYTRRRDAVDASVDPRARLRALIHAGLPTNPDDELCILLIEFIPQIRRHHVVNALRTTLYERQVALYESVLQTGAALRTFTLAHPALAVARNMVALEDEYGTHVVAGISLTRDEAEQQLVYYAEAATGCVLPAQTATP